MNHADRAAVVERLPTSIKSTRDIDRLIAVMCIEARVWFDPYMPAREYIDDDHHQLFTDDQCARIDELRWAATDFNRPHTDDRIRVTWELFDSIA